MTAITEFIQQLREFGTGVYLRPEERQYWEPPFDVNALPELEALLIGYAKSVPLDVPNPDIIRDHVLDLYAQLREFNARYNDAIIEPEEEAEITELVRMMWPDYAADHVPDFVDLDASTSE